MLVIEADSNYDFGYQIGRRYERLYRRVFSLSPPMNDAALRSRLTSLGQYCPDVIERMEGMARATGIELAALLSNSPGRRQQLIPSGCTNFAAVPPATRDKQVYLSWNNDLPRFFKWTMGNFPFYVRKIKGSYPYLCFDHSTQGVPLMYGIGVMNSEGLSSIYNAVGMTEGGDGLTFIELNNMWMEQESTVEGAVQVMRENPRLVVPGFETALLFNANWLVADRHGDAALMEYSHSHLEVTRASDKGGILASANHHQFLDRNRSGSADPIAQPAIAGSYARLARMWELLHRYHGDIDPRSARAISSDHGLNYESLEEYGLARPWYEERVDDSTICGHAWNFWRHLYRREYDKAVTELLVSVTLYCMLLEPKRCTLWFNVGHPCRNLYHPYWLGDILEMSHANSARGEISYRPEPAIPWKTRSGRGAVWTRPLSDPFFAQKTRSVAINCSLWLDRLIQNHLPAAAVTSPEQTRYGIEEQ
jgi:hypothetical protein